MKVLAVHLHLYIYIEIFFSALLHARNKHEDITSRKMRETGISDKNDNCKPVLILSGN